MQTQSGARNSIDVGDARSTGNRIVMAGGRIAAKTLNVKTGNGISAVLDHTAPVPATFETRATFEAGTTVWPLLADGVHDGAGGAFCAVCFADGVDVVDGNPHRAAAPARLQVSGV
ncbi:MAG: hypothetical protein ACOX9C_09435 [Kiritimatiellia bacterium]